MALAMRFQPRLTRDHHNQVWWLLMGSLLLDDVRGKSLVLNLWMSPVPEERRWINRRTEEKMSESCPYSI